MASPGTESPEPSLKPAPDHPGRIPNSLAEKQYQPFDYLVFPFCTIFSQKVILIFQIRTGQLSKWENNPITLRIASQLGKKKQTGWKIIFLFKDHFPNVRFHLFYIKFTDKAWAGRTNNDQTRAIASIPGFSWCERDFIHSTNKALVGLGTPTKALKRLGLGKSIPFQGFWVS